MKEGRKKRISEGLLGASILRVESRRARAGRISWEANAVADQDGAAAAAARPDHALEMDD